MWTGFLSRLARPAEAPLHARPGAGRRRHRSELAALTPELRRDIGIAPQPAPVRPPWLLAR